MENNIVSLIQLFEENRNEVQAGPMEKYMKDQFPFLGIKKPLRSELQKQFFKQTGVLNEPFNHEFVLALWQKDEREYQYAALILHRKIIEKTAKAGLGLNGNVDYDQIMVGYR